MTERDIARLSDLVARYEAPSASPRTPTDRQLLVLGASCPHWFGHGKKRAIGFLVVEG